MVATFLIAPARLVAQAPLITDWFQDSVTSSVLGDVRKYSVALPVTYNAKMAAGERYPVLLLLDAAPGLENLAARIANARALSDRTVPMIPELIIVAIETSRNRYRDMTLPPVGDQVYESTNVGGAQNFAKFLSAELLPLLASRYRTAPFNIIQGHSQTGLFAAYAYGQSPASFHAAIALSPSLMWNEGRAYDQVLAGVRGRRQSGYLFLGVSEDEGLTIPRLVRQLTEDLAASPAHSTIVSSHFYRGAVHSIVASLGLTEGLISIFKPIALGGLDRHRRTPDDFLRAYTQMRDRYVAKAPGFGMPPRMPSAFLFLTAISIVGEDPNLIAVVPMLCTELVESYPELWLGAACLGEYNLKQRDFDGAHAAFEQARAQAERSGDTQGVSFSRGGSARVAAARAPSTQRK